MFVWHFAVAFQTPICTLIMNRKSNLRKRNIIGNKTILNLLDYGRNWSEGCMAGTVISFTCALSLSLLSSPISFCVHSPCVCGLSSPPLLCVLLDITTLLCLLCMSFVLLSIPLNYLLLPRFPCSLHTDNSTTTQTPILWLNKKLTAGMRLECLAAKCINLTFVFWNTQLQKEMYELEKIAPTAPQEKNPFSGGKLVPSECSFRPGQALRE